MNSINSTIYSINHESRRKDKPKRKLTWAARQAIKRRRDLKFQPFQFMELGDYALAAEEYAQKHPDRPRETE